MTKYLPKLREKAPCFSRVRCPSLIQHPARTHAFTAEEVQQWIQDAKKQGESVASGVYFYTLKAGEFSATKKMLIRK